jgi:MFS transporter, DHA1 family, inner membrane transport protein
VTILPQPPTTLSIESVTNLQLAIVTIARLALNAAFRIIYPLQPFLSDQFNADLQTVSTLVTIQLLASLVSPLGGTLADTRGERTTMSLGLLLFCVGTLTCALTAGFTAFLTGYALIGLGVSIYQPAATAYLSARTPYSRRGWALGILETSWAGAALLGVAPLMQVVQITRSTMPVYGALCAAGVISLALVRFALPRVVHRKHATERRRIDWSAIRTPTVFAIIAVMAMTMFAYDIYGVAQGQWLREAFQANDGMLGQIFVAAGAAELCGSLLVIFLADRIGKKRAAFGGFICAALFLGALPFATGWGMLLVLLFLFFLAEEFAIVATLPLVSGVAPTARGTVVSLTMTIANIARAVGSVTSSAIFLAFGIGGITWIAAGCMFVAILIGYLYVTETEAQAEFVPAVL